MASEGTWGGVGEMPDHYESVGSVVDIERQRETGRFDVVIIHALKWFILDFVFRFRDIFRPRVVGDVLPAKECLVQCFAICSFGALLNTGCQREERTPPSLLLTGTVGLSV